MCIPAGKLLIYAEFTLLYKGYTVVIRDKKIVIECYEPLLMIIHESYRHVCWLMKPVTLQQCKRFPGQDMPLNVLVGVEVGMSVKVSCACFLHVM